MPCVSLKSVVASECRMGKLHELRNELKFKAHQNIRQNYNLFIYNCASQTQTAGSVFIYIYIDFFAPAELSCASDAQLRITCYQFCTCSITIIPR